MNFMSVYQVFTGTITNTFKAVYLKKFITNHFVSIDSDG